VLQAHETDKYEQRLKCFRVRTVPGKVCKVSEFKVEICHALKNLENDNRYG